MRNKIAVLAAATMLASAWTARAGIVAVANPGGTTTEIGARIRWGATGFEASLFDSNPLAQTPTLNPYQSPIWQLNQAYKFLVEFDPTTGTIDLSVDFNRDNDFGAGESISQDSFSLPPKTSYVGESFKYLSISGNEGGSTGRSTVNNLLINGTSLPSLSPNGLYLEQFYKDSSGGVLGPIAISGDLTFLTAGTGQERPSWNFNFKESAVVPEPSTYIAGALLLLPFAGATIRRLSGNQIE